MIICSCAVARPVWPRKLVPRRCLQLRRSNVVSLMSCILPCIMSSGMLWCSVQHQYTRSDILSRKMYALDLSPCVAASVADYSSACSILAIVVATSSLPHVHTHRFGHQE